MIEVVTGVEELDYVQIILMEELPPDTKIASKGAFYLYSTTKDLEAGD